MLQVATAAQPFRSPDVMTDAVQALRLLEAMGLLPDDEVIERLDAATLRRMFDAARRGGMQPAPSVPLHGRWPTDARQIGPALAALRRALEDSPVPETEWPSLLRVFGMERLAELTGVSKMSVRRYASTERATPDDVAGRLHFLAKLVGDLRGAYNDIGVRRWFDRTRTALGGRTPAELLRGRWDPDADDPMAVRRLARSLHGGGAT